MSTTPTKRNDGMENWVTNGAINGATSGATNVVSFRPRKARVLSIFQGVWLEQHRASRELTTVVTQLDQALQQLPSPITSLEQEQLQELQQGLEQVQQFVRTLSGSRGRRSRP